MKAALDGRLLAPGHDGKDRQPFRRVVEAAARKTLVTPSPCLATAQGLISGLREPDRPRRELVERNN